MSRLLFVLRRYILFLLFYCFCFFSGFAKDSGKDYAPVKEIVASLTAFNMKGENPEVAKYFNLYCNPIKGFYHRLLWAYNALQMRIDLPDREGELKGLTLKEQRATESEVRFLGQDKQLFIFSLLIVVVLFLVSFIVIFYLFKEKQKTNALLEQRNREIEEQRDVANKQKEKIMDSILYAKRIQNAILPLEYTIKQALPEHFIFFKPKDIVSGDFYWMTEKENVVIIAAADCTGHGVPGALMSMLGIAFLNEIVSKMFVNKHITSLYANEILIQLRAAIIRSLHQTGKRDEAADGIEMALCIIDMANNSLQYSGAYHPLYIIRNNELKEVSADKMPVSIYKNDSAPFTNHEIELKYGDMLYIFSDGYVDQFGGKQGLKFMSSRFKELLLAIHKRPVKEQKELMEAAHEEWKGKNEQLDDILVIGIKAVKFEEKPQKDVNDRCWPDKHILIAEDMDMNYLLLVEALKPKKTKITRAINGYEAVEFCKSVHFDMILMDISMPIMDGYEATRLIREFNKDTPIIAQTALSDVEKLHCIEAGCNDFIAKPINFKLFIEVLTNYLY
jgi:CheY-like chemotaxis protein/serine phosphatase RsbU (regulator of sigma subunit)